MDLSQAPDPFAALGLPENATSADIKTAYRKLVLKCHPDKVADEALKKIKQEEFHKIQQAYELVGDDERLQAYRAQVKLDAERKAKLASRAASSPNVTRYDVRTAAPSGSGAPYSTSTHHRYEERKPTASRSFEDDHYYKSRPKHYDTYEAYPKQSSRTARPEKEPVRVSRVSADRSRSDRNKTRDKEERRNRSEKFAHHDEDPSSNDEKARFEALFRKNAEDARVRDGAADLRRKTDERIRVEEAARKKSESRRSYEERETVKEPRRQRSDERDPEPHRKSYDIVADKEAAARAHISKTMSGAGTSPSKTMSRDAPHDMSYESSRSRRERPEQPRRSSARPRDRDRDRGDRGVPEIVEWESRDSRPSFQKSSSSPADIKLPQRAPPVRSYTEVPRDSRRAETSPSPQFRRSETMPTVHTTSSSRREDYKSRPSTLRSSESLAHPTSSPEGAYTSVPHGQTSSSSSRKYYYPSSSGTREREREHAEVANGHSTVLREPHRHRTRSPSPLSRPPMGPNRHQEAPPPPRPTTLNTPPQLVRSQTLFADTPRGRDRLYGERTTAESLRRAEDRRQTSYSPDKVSFSRRYGHEDVNYASRRGEEFSRPNFSRSATVNVH